MSTQVKEMDPFSLGPKLGLLLLLAALSFLLCAEAHSRASASPKGIAPDASSSTSVDAGLINLNSATTEQLQLLPGIGPSKAGAILQFRQRQPFRATYQLMGVKGIGRKTYRRLRPYLTVKGDTTLRHKPPSKPKPRPCPLSEGESARKKP
jgi:competence protein ComEA